MRRYTFLMVLLALPSLGYTNCSQFSTVTVPAVDNTDPIAGFKVIRSGQSPVIHYGDADYTTDNPNLIWTIVPFGYDAGGMQELDVLKTRFRVDGGCTILNNGDFSPDNDTQPQADPGETSTNGIYLHTTVSASTDISPTGCRVEWRYRATATDQAGNEDQADFSLI